MTLFEGIKEKESEKEKEEKEKLKKAAKDIKEALETPSD